MEHIIVKVDITVFVNLVIIGIIIKQMIVEDAIHQNPLINHVMKPI